MGEIPWQNIALWLLMRAAQRHPEWDERACSMLAVDAEERAVARDSDVVCQQDVRAAIAVFTEEHVTA